MKFNKPITIECLLIFYKMAFKDTRFEHGIVLDAIF